MSAEGIWIVFGGCSAGVHYRYDFARVGRVGAVGAARVGYVFAAGLEKKKV